MKYKYIQHFKCFRKKACLQMYKVIVILVIIINQFAASMDVNFCIVFRVYRSAFETLREKGLSKNGNGWEFELCGWAPVSRMWRFLECLHRKRVRDFPPPVIE